MENTKKKAKKLGIIFFSTTLVVMVLAICITCSLGNHSEDENITTIRVKNQNPTDSVLVYLTLNTGVGFVSDVNGVFGIQSTKTTQGSFWLGSQDSVSYKCASGLAISGNISFWNPPLNCPFEGTTLFEFTLNNSGTVSKAQETVDLSCVAGVTCIGSIDMVGGLSDWTDNSGNDNVTHIQNDSLYKNTGISGVFPYGCTNCVNTQGAPECDNSPSSYATPNTKKLCNVQREATKGGGTVIISYLNR